MSKVEWLCSRCADKEDKKTEPDPVVLRLCTSCKVENWVRPFAHSGEAVSPTPEEKDEALAFHAQKMKVLKKATENRMAKDAEDYKEAEKQVLEAESIPSEERKEMVKILDPDLNEEEVAAKVAHMEEVKIKVTVDTTEAVEALEELEEKADPYKGLTKDQLVELLKEKE